MGLHVAATAATTSLTQPSSPSASPASFPRLPPSPAAAAPHVQAVKHEHTASPPHLAPAQELQEHNLTGHGRQGPVGLLVLGRRAPRSGRVVWRWRLAYMVAEWAEGEKVNSPRNGMGDVRDRAPSPVTSTRVEHGWMVNYSTI